MELGFSLQTMCSILGVSPLSRGNSVLSSPDVWTVFVSEDRASVHPQHTGLLLAAGLDFSVTRELPVERQFPEVRSHHMRNLNVTNMPSYSGVLGTILP